MNWKPTAAVILIALASACAPARDCSVALWYLDAEADEVAVTGDFNGWGAQAMETDGAGTWGTTLDLPAGRYEYLFAVDGEAVMDPFAALTRWDGEDEVSLLRVDDCAQPALALEASEASADGALSVEATWLRGAGGARLDRAEAETFGGAPLEVSVRSRGRITASAEGLPPGKHTVLLTAWDKDGDAADLRIPLWVEDAPLDWEDALIYQVMVDRFAGAAGALDDPAAPGDRAGGDLLGLLDVLESGYFEQLGASALWLSPMYENPDGYWDGVDGREYESYHGYWPVSTAGVEQDFGGDEALHAVVDAAHARGLRVILDVVPNHVHQSHPWYDASPSWFNDDPDCICGDYTCPWSDAIETCWFTDYLPDLDWTEPEVAEAMVPATVAWALDFDLDGMRIDAVPMMPRAALRELVAGLGAALENGPTRFYTLGETFTGPEDYADIRTNLGPFGLDGQFEFPILWALRDLVAWESGDAAALARVIDESLAQWAGSGSVMAPFVGNHDMTRFLSEAAGSDLSSPWDRPPEAPDAALPYDKLVMAQAVALSLPGAPVIYYGDEYGQPGANDPDNRRVMRFADDRSALEADTFDRVARLGRARRCSHALRRGDYRPLLTDGGALAFLRDAGDGLPALTVLNASDASVDLALPLDADAARGVDRFVDVIAGGEEDLAPVDRPGLPARHPRLPDRGSAMTAMMILLALVGCRDPDCVWDWCEDAPDDIPWEPGEGDTAGDEYGSGGGSGGDDGGTDDGGDTDDTTEEQPDVEIVAVRSCDVELRHKPSDSYGTVEVAGEFNGWTPEALGGPDGEGFYSLTVPDLGYAPGEYAHKFIYDGDYEGAPPANAYAKWTGGSENRNLRVGDCTKPLLQVVSAASDASGWVDVQLQFASSVDEHPVDEGAIVATVGGVAVTPEVDAAAGTIRVYADGLAPGKHTVRVSASDSAGTASENRTFTPLWVEDTPFQWDDGYLYFAFTDRFRNGDYGADPLGPIEGLAECSNYQGGDFLGVLDAKIGRAHV